MGLISLILISLAITSNLAYDYSKRGINWAQEGDPDFNPACTGTSQSPINIIRAETVPLSVEDIGPMRYACGDVSGKFLNNGHTLKFETSDGNPIVSEQSYMTGGPLNDDKYYFWQLHLHWGFWNCNGSEHTVDNGRFPAELHLVHVLEYFIGEDGTIDPLVFSTPGGLSVLGIFLDTEAESSAKTSWFNVRQIWFSMPLCNNYSKNIFIAYCGCCPRNCRLQGFFIYS